jgi:hypothetical protein
MGAQGMNVLDPFCGASGGSVQDPDHHFAILQLSVAMRSRNGFNAVSLFSISRMRASASASFCLSVAISAAAVALRSAMIAFVSRDRADCALPLSGFAKSIANGTCLRCGHADRVFLPSGLAKKFGDNSGVPSRHWLAGLDRLYQRAGRSD